MKALIKGGFFLALGWLAAAASAQEIQFRASGAKNSSVAVGDSGVRAVSVGQPVPLDAAPAAGLSSFRPLSSQPGLTARGQAPEEKTLQAVPQLEIIVGDQKPPQPMPKSKSDKFTPPPPSAVVPSPVLGSLGMSSDDCCSSECCTEGRGWRGWRGWCVGSGGDCCPERSCFWVSADYLLWWQRGQHNLAPLVTTSPAGTPTINSGVLGQASTGVLYDSVPNAVRNGGRFDLGFWLPHCCNLGVDLNYLMLGQLNHNVTFASNGNPQIARPIFNVITQKPGSELVAINNPDRLLTGTVSVHDYSQIWGAEANLRYKLCCGPNYWLDLLVGYRHWNMSESIDITENLQNFDPRTRQAAGNFLVQDSFATRNQFNGFQMGLEGEYRFCKRAFFGWDTKLAMGSVYQIVNINGSTTFSNFPAGFNNTFPGGLLALPGTNIGHFSQTRFGVMPEVGFKVGYDINDHWRLYAGYSSVFLNSVARPSDQINLNVNPNFQPSAAGPGPATGVRQPAVLMGNSNYWAQGFNFGVMYRY